MHLLVSSDMIYNKKLVFYSSSCVQRLVYVWHVVTVKKYLLKE